MKENSQSAEHEGVWQGSKLRGIMRQHGDRIQREGDSIAAGERVRWSKGGNCQLTRPRSSGEAEQTHDSQ